MLTRMLQKSVAARPAKAAVVQGERRLAYAGYVAALDREEQAARTYAGHVDRIRRLAT